MKTLIILTASALLVGCNPSISSLDRASGVNPQVINIVAMARNANSQDITDAAILSFYFNNRSTLSVKDVDYLAYKTRTKLGEDIMRADWLASQRIQPQELENRK